MGNERSANLESKILTAAREIFIAKGYEETSMSEIAARVGINRPVLHYYYRTKDKMFQAVFCQIVCSFIPRIKEIVMRKDLSVGERVGCVVDTYYSRVLKENPGLPLFIIKEINRDSNHLLQAIHEMQLDNYVGEMIASLNEEMHEGKIRNVPIHIIFLNFYSQLMIPYVAKNLVMAAFPDNGNFTDLLIEWKPYIIHNMEQLLRP